jgi:hypothetical protein
MATPSLSPKALERIRRHHHAVAVLAHRSAKKAVVAQLRAQGLKPQHYSAREIAILADDYLAQHRARLIVDAEQIIATSPYFARWRCAELNNDAQTQKPHKSITSTVQMSGAK